MNKRNTVTITCANYFCRSSAELVITDLDDIGKTVAETLQDRLDQKGWSPVVIGEKYVCPDCYKSGMVSIVTWVR